jgi:hypothetical protein
MKVKLPDSFVYNWVAIPDKNKISWDILSTQYGYEVS